MKLCCFSIICQSCWLPIFFQFLYPTPILIEFNDASSSLPFPCLNFHFLHCQVSQHISSVPSHPHLIINILSFLSRSCPTTLSPSYSLQFHPHLIINILTRSCPTTCIPLSLHIFSSIPIWLSIVTNSCLVFQVFFAALITLVVTVALTMFAFQTKVDFTAMGGILFVAVIILMVFGIVCMFFPGKTMILVYSSLGALIFSIYIVYDTQMMLGGDHKYSISPEEYVFAALNLYMDIVNLFIYILTIIGASRD